MNLASEQQEAKYIGSAHNRNAMPFTTSPAPSSALWSSQTNSTTPLASAPLKTTPTSTVPCSQRRQPGDQGQMAVLEHSQPPSGLLIDKESEGYRMLQEKHKLNEPPKHSTSFTVLQEILEFEEKGDSNKPSGCRSVKAPATKVAASIGNAQKLPMTMWHRHCWCGCQVAGPSLPP